MLFRISDTHVDPDTDHTCWSGYPLNMLIRIPAAHVMIWIPATVHMLIRILATHMLIRDTDYTCLSRYRLHMLIRDTDYTCLSRYRLHMFWSGCRPKFLILLHSYSWRKKRERQHNLIWSVINKNIMFGGSKQSSSRTSFLQAKFTKLYCSINTKGTYNIYTGKLSSVTEWPSFFCSPLIASSSHFSLLYSVL